MDYKILNAVGLKRKSFVVCKLMFSNHAIQMDNSHWSMSHSFLAVSWWNLVNKIVGPLKDKWPIRSRDRIRSINHEDDVDRFFTSEHGGWWVFGDNGLVIIVTTTDTTIKETFDHIPKLKKWKNRLKLILHQWTGKHKLETLLTWKRDYKHGNKN